jgi:hypothetical protein
VGQSDRRNDDHPVITSEYEASARSGLALARVGCIAETL